ncbi:MAG TPA: hypothetical protein VES40_12505, partial [Ilumatobacteraceae bacterium]|nr:hypothetical protein [Ilumatobacteraceae bacterium]
MSTSPWSPSSRGGTLARASPWSGSPATQQSAPATSSSTAQSGSADQSSGAPKVGRLIEVLTVVLLGVASIGSAWSAYQVSQWNGVETDEARASAVYRIDASREYALATQTVAYDAAAVSQYAQSIAAENVELQVFLRETIVRPAFRPIIDEWKAVIDAGELPTNLLQDEEYLSGLFAESTAADAAALAASTSSEAAGNNADGYIRITLFF